MIMSESSAEKKTTLDYTVDFPKLPDAPSATSTSSSVAAGVWTGSAQPAIKSSVVTEAFKLSAEERASRGFGKAFGTASEEQQKCNQIAHITGTKIELNEAKDQSITILITGKQKNVEEARTRLVRELQTQATIRLEIPKEYHSFIIGKQGSKLRQFEQKFLCRIHMPNREEKSDVIRIVGPNEYIVEAGKHIKAIADEMAKQKTEHLDIPRSFYQWIRGANNERVDELMSRTGTKINIPPAHANNETIVITGEREGVETAAAEINNIFQEKKDTVVTVEITVKKPQHRFIIGRKRQGIEDIFRDTEVLVDLPAEDDDSETIVLRGPKDKIGDAVGAVYQRASSMVATELPYEEWMRRHLIGPKGQNLQGLVPNQDKLKIDFDDGGFIYIEGPPEQVKQAQTKLSAEIARLGNDYSSEVMHVAPSLHRHVIGRSGALVNKLKEEFDVQISVPNENSRSDLIRLDGKKENVGKVRAAIAEIVSKQEKKVQEDEEKRKKAAVESAKTNGTPGAPQAQPAQEEPHANIQVEVDPKFHRHFIVRGAEVLREIQHQCGNCQISFPKQETGEKMVSIRGPKSGAEAAKKRILGVVAELEAQTQIQVEVDPKHHRHFIVKGAEVLREIQHQFGNCQISFPKQETGESAVTIKGHKDHAEAAKKRILDIVHELESLVQEQLEVDPKHHRHFIVKGAEVLKDIQAQCGNCQISFPKQETGESQVSIKGHKTTSPTKSTGRISSLLNSLSREGGRMASSSSCFSSPFPLLLCLFLAIDPARAFNVDTRLAQVHRRPNSGFGWALDFAYRDQRRGKYTLLVGAPFAQTSQRRLQKTGAVFGCEVDQNLCVELLFDQKGNELRLNGSSLLPIEEKSHQMFGATVVASKNADSVLACAPHYKYFFAKFEVVEPVGSCYYARDYFSRIQEYAPCRQEPARHGHHRLGYGMCGFSAAVPDNGDQRLFISGPGVWYWQGSVFSQSVQNITDRPSTADGPAHTDHHQLGYSTAAGDFDGDKLDDIVVGVPRGNELVGMVSIYTRELRPIANLTEKGGQRGQYFGASVAVLDLNNDGLQDLVVGSPLYIDWTSVDAKTQQRKPRYDIGKISVFMQTGTGAFKEPVHILGMDQWGRFGFSLASAGDLNGDGFQDLLVGAPYDGEDGRGAVYVFHGSEEGIIEKYTQRILAKDINRDIRTFGFSLAAGRDLDANGYPDIAIGAPQSNQAVVLRTRPVIQVTGSVRTTRKTINLDDKQCVTEFGKMPCERLKVCLKYAGKQLGAEHGTAELRVEIQLDALKEGLSSRAFFSRKELEKRRGIRVHPASSSREQPDRIEHVISLNKGREHCESYDVYIPDTIRDKISPIMLSVNYSYVEREGGGLEPAVDTTLGGSMDTELIIEKDCGEDNVCVPDLHILAMPAKEKFTIGTLDQTLTLNVSVENRGEDSYLTQYFVTIPPGFEYGGIENYETKYSVSCSPAEQQPDKSQPYQFVCDIGNPLPAGAKAAFGFKLRGGPDVDLSKEFVEVRMGVNSTNEEEPSSREDNQMVLRVPLEINAQMALIGRSNPEQVDYSVRNRTQGTAATFDFEIGPVVSHLFQVTNRGPSAIAGAHLDIVWPSYSDTGKHLLYLIDQPFVSDSTKAKCRLNQPQNINPANLAISNEHVPTPGPSGVQGISVEGEEEEAAEEEAEEEGTEQHAEAGEEEQEELKVDREEQAEGEEAEGEEGEEEEEEDEAFYGKKRRKREQKQPDVRQKRQQYNQQQQQSDASSAAVRRNLRQQKLMLREAVDQAKEAGNAVEYFGQLGRKTLNCAALNCTHIECDIGRLEENEFVLVEIFSRLWVNTLIEDDVLDGDISSLAFARISALPSIPKYNPPLLVIAVNTEVNPTDPEGGTWELPWWLWLLAILIALLLLAVIIFCCWQCGFFKRTRPPREKARLRPAANEAEQFEGEGGGGAAGPGGDGYYADNSARYAQPQMYSSERHGARV